jgi:pantetheine-phosphate adenylyltransferase
LLFARVWYGALKNRNDGFVLFKAKKSGMKICLFPGTFDPITLGHIDIINRALPLFDKVVVGIGRNANKVPMFSEEQRLQWLTEIYHHNPKVEAVVYEGLTVACCKRVGASYIIRGIRYVNDFEYEKAIADMNRSINNHIETVFFTCLPQYTSVASTLVRDVIKNGGDVSQFVPAAVNDSILSHFPVKNS